MRLYLALPNEPVIEGYEFVRYTPFNIDLNSVEDNECEEIVAKKLLDRFPIENAGQILALVCSKLRIGGELKLTGLSAISFADELRRGYTNTKPISQILAETNSIHDRQQIIEGLRGYGMDILTVNVNGIEYEITARRQ